MSSLKRLPMLAGIAALAAAPAFGQGAGPAPSTPPPVYRQSDGKALAVVAADGSGDYRTVQEALAAAPTGTRAHPSVIRVRPGTYREVVYAQREKRFVSLVGDDPATTTIIYGLYAAVPGPDGKPLGTFRTPTVTIDADDFTVENLTLQNDAGPRGQALALRVDGDRVAFRHCRFAGWQDTILANRGRHFYTDCDVSGATDFIFGGATEFYDHCRLHCLGDGYVTAASTPDDQPSGFVFSHCAIDGATPAVRSYLGRPWRDYAAVTYLDTTMTAVIRPEGWSNWAKTDRDKTARYAEYHSGGPGGVPQARVPWSRQLTGRDAAALTISKVLGGPDHWDPTR